MNHHIKQQLTSLLIVACFAAGYAQAASCPQKAPLQVNKKLIQKISALSPDSSNANSIEKLIGPPCSCYTADASPNAESWSCQWKGNLSDNRLENTLTVSFEAGMLTRVVAITADRTSYMAEPGGKLTRYAKANFNNP